MTLNEKKIAMAGRLGICLHLRTEHYQVQGDSGFTCLDCKKDTYGLKRPEFDSDWNTRPEILKAMNTGDKDELVKLILPIIKRRFDHASVILEIRDAMITAYSMPQPDFFNLAGVAMGLWEEDACLVESESGAARRTP